MSLPLPNTAYTIHSQTPNNEKDNIAIATQSVLITSPQRRNWPIPLSSASCCYGWKQTGGCNRTGVCLSDGHYSLAHTNTPPPVRSLSPFRRSYELQCSPKTCILLVFECSSYQSLTKFFVAVIAQGTLAFMGLQPCIVTSIESRVTKTCIETKFDWVSLCDWELR